MNNTQDENDTQLASRYEIWRERAREKIESGRNIYLFGAGRYGEFVYRHIFQGKGVRCFIDNDAARWGIKCSGLIVHSFERLLYEEPFTDHCAAGSDEKRRDKKKPLVLITVFSSIQAANLLNLCKKNMLDAEIFCPGSMVPVISAAELPRPPKDSHVNPDGYASHAIHPREFAREFIEYLGSNEASLQLTELFTHTFRWTALLDEMNRRAAIKTNDFIDQHLSDCLFSTNQRAVIGQCRDSIREHDGHIMEFGVYQGTTIRWLAEIFPECTIHGFDSFEGLPENWVHARKGTFNCNGIMPTVPKNVILHKGWFNETLPGWVRENSDKSVSLLRIDCDLYSSTKVVLDALKPLILPGTWILFDELIGYRGWEKHEYRALQEFLAETGLHYEYHAFGLTYVMGCIR